MQRQQIQEWLQRLESRAVLLARDVRRGVGPTLRAGWVAARPMLRTALEIFLALIIVFEEWGWRPLADLLGRLASWDRGRRSKMPSSGCRPMQRW